MLLMIDICHAPHLHTIYKTSPASIQTRPKIKVSSFLLLVPHFIQISLYSYIDEKSSETTKAKNDFLKKERLNTI